MDSTFKKIEHGDLINWVRLHTPQLSDKGVCNGVTSMWIQAVITSKEAEDNFYKGLDKISAYLSEPSNTLKKLKKEVDELYDSQKNPTEDPNFERKPLTNEDLDKMELSVFAESVAIQQAVNKLNIFENYVSEIDKQKLYPYTASASLERSASKIRSDTVGIVGLTAVELEKYLDNIKEILEKDSKAHPGKRGAFLLCSDNHAVGMYLDVPSKKWHYFDINQLSGKKEYYFSENSHELTPTIFNGFMDNRTSSTVFSAQYISTYHDESLVASLQDESNKLLVNSINRKNARGENTFLLSVERGIESNIKTLLKASSERNKKIDSIWADMILAIQQNDLVKAEGLYLELRRVVNRIGSFMSWNIFLDIAQKGDANKLKYFLTTSEKIDLANESASGGMTAFLLAAENGNLEILKALLETEPKQNIEVVNSDGANALVLAAQKNQTEMIKYLLSLVPKLDVNLANNEGWNALMYAAYYGYKDAVEALLSTGSKLMIKAVNLDLTARAIASIQGYPEIAQLILDAELRIAAAENDLTTINALLSSDPKPNLEQKNEEGYNALMLACVKGNEQVIKLLLSTTPKSNIEVKNNDGWTPIMLAAYYGKVDAVKALLAADQKPDLTKVNTEGKTARDLALDSGNEEIIKLLQNPKEEESFFKPVKIYLPGVKSVSPQASTSNSDSENTTKSEADENKGMNKKI